jgi:hypothetical protein
MNKKPIKEKELFNPDACQNWLFEDDPGYAKTRRKRKKKRKKK